MATWAEFLLKKLGELTTNLGITKVDPEHRQTDSASGEYTRIIKTATGHKVVRYNRCYKPGAVGKALQFNGTNCVNFGADASLDITGLFTIRLWFKSSTAQSNKPLAAKWNPQYAWVVLVENSKIRFYARSGAASKGVITTNTYMDGNWHQVVAIMDGSNVKIRIDGDVEKKTGDACTSIDSAAAVNVKLATYSDASGAYIGIADDPIIENEAWSDQDCLDDYNAGAGFYQSVGANTKLLAHLDDQANPTADETGVNNGTLVNSPSWVTGLLLVPGTVTEVEVWSSEDGVAASEEGIQKFGDPDGATHIRGTIKADLALDDSHTATGLRTSAANGEPIVQSATITPTNIDDAITKKHTQNTDTTLEDGASVDSVTVETGGIVNLPKQSRARAYRSTAPHSIPSGSWTKIILDGENYDNQNEFDPITNNRFTASKAGYYAVSAAAWWSSPTAGARYMIGIYKNGASVSQAASHASTTNADIGTTVSDVVYLAANDYIELYVHQNSGGNQSVLNASSATYLAVHKIS
jgi:hypothetical protein